jgi:hypothetical protein
MAFFRTVYILSNCNSLHMSHVLQNSMYFKYYVLSEHLSKDTNSRKDKKILLLFPGMKSSEWIFLYSIHLRICLYVCMPTFLCILSYGFIQQW